MHVPDFDKMRLMRLSNLKLPLVEGRTALTSMSSKAVSAGNAPIYRLFTLRVLQVPFERMTVGQIFFAVVHQKQRPPIPEGAPPAYVQLMQQCWADDAKERPVISEVLKRVQKLYKEHRSKTVSKAYSSPPL